METEQSHVRILNLTLEVVYLLTGENYIAFKLSDGLVASNVVKIKRPISHSVRKNKKVQEVTNEIIELLTREDVSFSSCTPDVMMENWPPLTSPDGSRNSPENCPSPLYFQNIAQEHQEIPQDDQGMTVISQTGLREETKDPYVWGNDPCKEEKIPSEIITIDTQEVYKCQEEEGHVQVKVEDVPPEISLDGSRDSPKSCPCLFNPQNIAKEHQEIPQDYQGVTVISQAEDPYARGNDHCKEEKIPPDIIKIDTQNVYKYQEEGAHVQVKVEDTPSEISSDGQYKNNLKNGPILSPEFRYDSTEKVNFPRQDLPSKHKGRFSGVSPFTNLTSHKEREKFSCSVCGKVFSRRAILISHQRTHTVEKPYSCPICGKCFSRKSTFIEHERTHKGEKPYSCSECGKCFTQIGHLIVHQRIHRAEKPYPCSECGKCFTQIGNLIVHQRTHTGEKPYSCSVCGKQFPISSAVTRHKRIHTGEKPYSCSECGKGFTRKANLIFHQRAHSG